jgi:hypothetical protein
MKIDIFSFKNNQKAFVILNFHIDNTYKNDQIQNFTNKL